MVRPDSKRNSIFVNRTALTVSLLKGRLLIPDTTAIRPAARTNAKASASPSFDRVDHSMVGLAITQAETNGPVLATCFT